MMRMMQRLTLLVALGLVSACSGDDPGQGRYACVMGGSGVFCSGPPNGFSYCATSESDAFNKCFGGACNIDCVCDVQFQGADTSCGTASDGIGQSSDYLIRASTDIRVDLDSTGQSFMVFFQDNNFVSETNVAGSFYFGLIGTCPGASCSLRLDGIDVRPAAPFSITHDGNTITNQLLTSANHPTALLNGDFFELPPGSTDLISGYLRDGDQRVAQFTNGLPYGATFDLNTGLFETNLVLNNNSGGQVLVFLEGTIVGHPPVADAGNDLTGCDAVTLDGTGSSDPDGDIIHWIWQENETVLGDAQTLNVALPDGSHTITLTTVDSRGASNTDSIVVTIGDTNAPIISPTGSGLIATCTPDPQPVAIPAPMVVDDCDPNPTLTGSVTEVNGQVLSTPIPIVGGTATLPLGTHTIPWEAEDADGHTATLEQVFAVEQQVTTACCDGSQIQIVGDDSPNHIAPRADASYCVLAKGGNDLVRMPNFDGGNDFISGDPGSDNLDGRGGNDLMLGGTGSDSIEGGDSGLLTAYGGPDADQLWATQTTSSVLSGGSGDDLLSGGAGPDLIYPGGGSDLVLAFAGDDTVVIRNECEVQFPQVIINGGLGTDTLVAPVLQAELAAMGVLVLGFENFVIDTSQRHLSECF